MGRLARGLRLLGLAMTLLVAPAGEDLSRTAASSGPLAPPVSRWEVTVSKAGKLVIRNDGGTVVESSYVFWGKDWRFASARFQVGAMEGGVARFAGDVARLGLRFTGSVRNPSPEVLLIEYQMQAAEKLDDVVGGGIEWRCRPESRALGRRPPDPVLLGGNAGWEWEVAPGHPLSVRFGGPAASVYFEHGDRARVRTFFVEKAVDRGTRSFTMTVTLPPGGRVPPSVDDRYGPDDTRDWYRGALPWDASPVDVSDLNAGERPAGRRGFVRAEGDRLVFGDGTPARFWGGNIAAHALFSTKPAIATQARRAAQLGYNLMRLHHHDSTRWVSPTVIDKKRDDSVHMDPDALDKIDWWIKCLKDEGIYVWLDLHVGRQFKGGDGIGRGFDEIARAKGDAKGFNYLNPRVQELMKGFQAAYLHHVNPYTKLAYKDDPAVMGVLITNENDMTQHGHFALPDKGNPVHGALFMGAAKAFAASSGLPAGLTWRTWEPGPSKVFLNDLEHRFNETMLGDLKRLGVRAPIATTNYWAGGGLYSLPALADGDVIDVHSYGLPESLGVNLRYEPNFLSWIAAAQVAGKPLTVTEWNVAYPAADRCTSPLYVAAVASLQGWDAPMIYNYSQAGFGRPYRSDTWSTFYDPALSGMMPAAAVAFRRGHVSPARETYCLEVGPERLPGLWSPDTSATIRTLTERSRLVIGLPALKELPWLRQSPTPPGARVVTDPDRDFIPPGQDFVESDTGELRHDWAQGIEVVDTPRTQAVAGWVGGHHLRSEDASFRLETRKAAVAVTSLDDRPIATSRKILISALARVVASPGETMPYLSEPVVGSIAIDSRAGDMELVSLGPDGRELAEPPPRRDGNSLTIRLPSTRGTHWFLLKARPSQGGGGEPSEGGQGRRPQAVSSRPAGASNH